MADGRALRGACFAAALSACLLGGGCGSEEPAQNVVLISLDTLRRDHLSTYGYERDTAPFLAAFAGESTVFTRAIAQDTNTNPSHTSMLTGVYPHVHGSRANGVPLAPGQVTLAAILRNAGFRTGGFVSGAPMRENASGLSRGFEIYDDDFRRARRDGRETTGRALEWLRGIPAEERYFLFVHLFDAHGPYRPPAEYGDLFRSESPGPKLRTVPDYQGVRDGNGRIPDDLNVYVDRYDAMIRVVDECIASLLEAVELERTVVIVIADHGETFDERYAPLGHGAAVYDEQIRIPLVIRAPGHGRRRVEDLVETVDLLPTILELSGVERPAARPVQGSSLVGAMDGARLDRRFAFSSARAADVFYQDRGYRFDSRRRIQSIRSNRWKLIRYPGEADDYVELYDLESDPRELESVADGNPAIRDEYLEVLDDWAAEGASPAAPPELDPELREKFKALGYVD